MEKKLLKVNGNPRSGLLGFRGLRLRVSGCMRFQCLFRGFKGYHV